jgi:hypothetical protein
MDLVSIKYTNIFHCKTLQNLPKFGFLVCKQTIWQPWFGPVVRHKINSLRAIYIHESPKFGWTTHNLSDDKKNEAEYICVARHKIRVSCKHPIM